MSTVELQSVTKKFGDTVALNNVSFTVNDGEFFVLLGPTGAGKTTTLRVIAGLEKQDEGTIIFDGQSVDDTAPADRDVAFVFQQYSLYPNMTVYDNLAFPLRSPMRRTPENVIKERIEITAAKLHITHLLERKTAKLSGGEMQRVSIGRAIVREPRIYLMDEPLSNLDAKLREALRVELEHIQKTQGSTTLFVTHDQIEALTMADRIGVLDEGNILQIGSPHDIYDRPATTFVSTLVGSPQINLLESERVNGQIQVMNSTIKVDVPTNLAVPDQIALVLGIRPEDIRLNPDGAFKGEVALIEPIGVETIIHIRSEQQTLLSVVPGVSTHKLGDTVSFDVVRDRLHLFKTDGQRIVENA